MLGVSDPSVFQPLEYVVVHDDVSDPLLTRITRIDPSGRLVIRDPVDHRFMVSRRAFVRSMYYNGMGPRSVYRESDHWVALVTALPGAVVREFATRAVSKSLEGPYSIDFNYGLVLDPDQTNSRWDLHAAENFCAVVLNAGERPA
jgi:hypothetical protein